MHTPFTQPTNTPPPQPSLCTHRSISMFIICKCSMCNPQRFLKRLNFSDPLLENLRVLLICKQLSYIYSQNFQNPQNHRNPQNPTNRISLNKHSKVKFLLKDVFSIFRHFYSYPLLIRNPESEYDHIN